MRGASDRLQPITTHIEENFHLQNDNLVQKKQCSSLRTNSFIIQYERDNFSMFDQTLFILFYRHRLPLWREEHDVTKK